MYEGFSWMAMLVKSIGVNFSFTDHSITLIILMLHKHYLAGGTKK